MVWVTVWKGGRSDLMIMTRDEDSPRKGYTAKSYQRFFKRASYHITMVPGISSKIMLRFMCANLLESCKGV